MFDDAHIFDSHGIMPDDAHTQYTVDDVLTCSGLNPLSFYGRLLDAGCGKNARLVHYLRRRGIQADGFDLELQETADYLMRCSADQIPKPGNYYDYAISHMSIFRGGIKLRLVERFDPALVKDFYAFSRTAMLRDLQEVLRVLKSGGGFAIYPNPSMLLDNDYAAIESLGATIAVEDVDSSFFTGIEDLPESLTELLISPDQRKRAVLTKR